MSDLSADDEMHSGAENKGCAKGRVGAASQPRIVLERGFALALAAGLAFWFFVAWLIWFR